MSHMGYVKHKGSRKNLLILKNFHADKPKLKSPVVILFLFLMFDLKLSKLFKCNFDTASIFS